MLDEANSSYEPHRRGGLYSIIPPPIMVPGIGLLAGSRWENRKPRDALTVTNLFTYHDTLISCGLPPPSLPDEGLSFFFGSRALGLLLQS